VKEEGPFISRRMNILLKVKRKTEEGSLELFITDE
jgi:hypothetical protein